MLRGELDISSEAIGSGLARALIEHYKISKGPIISDGEIIIDNCLFTVTVLADSITRAVGLILVCTSKRMPKQYSASPLIPPELQGMPLTLTSHTIDLQEKTASATTVVSLRLSDAYCSIIQDAVRSILGGEMEEMDEEF